MMNRFIRRLTLTALSIMLVATSVILVGCEEQKLQIAATSPRIDLSSTRVPNIDLDAYAYAKQENPTKIPKEIIGTPSDLTVESLALWGVARDDDFTIGGALTLTSAAEVASVLARIPSQVKIWTTVSDRTLYFVYGSAAAAEQLKAAISKNDFKYYDDQAALQEVAHLPNSGPTKLAAVAIVKPNKSLVKLAAKYSGSRISSMVDSLVTQGRVQVMAVGLCAPQQIDVADVVLKFGLGTIWESDLGMVASVKSSLPGFLVNPAASRFLGNAGYAKVNVGELTLYKGSLNAGTNKTVPVLVSLEGNRIFAASGKESYAQTLITRVNR